MRKRAIPRSRWAIVDRYDVRGAIGVEDLYTSRRGAIEAAKHDIRSGYTINGKLSVVLVTIDASTEIAVTAEQRSGGADGK